MRSGIWDKPGSRQQRRRNPGCVDLPAILEVLRIAGATHVAEVAAAGVGQV
jgi:hypothetical protein